VKENFKNFGTLKKMTIILNFGLSQDVLAQLWIMKTIILMVGMYKI
jgi:hypothetical protein